MAKEQANPVKSTVEERLKALYRLQRIESKIDEIRTLRGELPLEVSELEEEVEGLNTRISRYKSDVERFNDEISSEKLKIEEAQAKITKKEEEKNQVRNNREFDALSKEIEYQELDMELSNKNIRKLQNNIERRTEDISQAAEHLKSREDDLKDKKKALSDIITETEQDEKKLIALADATRPLIDERSLMAYNRIRNKARNGLAVVTVQRDSCGGCFNMIPPQRQLDVKMRKKMIVCEFCGRMLVDEGMAEEYDEEVANSKK